MSKKRQTRNSKKFKKAAASQRARAPMQKGGRAGSARTMQFIDANNNGTDDRDERTGKTRRPAGQTDGINPNPMKDLPPRTTAGPKRPAGQTDGINPNPMKDFPPRTTAGPKRPPDIGTPRPEPRPTGVSERPDNTEGQ